MRTDVIRKRDLLPGMCYILGKQYIRARAWFIISVGETTIVSFYVLRERSTNRIEHAEIVNWNGLNDDAVIFDDEFVRVH